MKIIKKIGIALILFLMASGFLVVHFYVPRHHVVTITGAEVMRKDQSASGQKNPESPQVTRDTFYVYGDDLETGQPRVYENEDNGWYFKFNSADVQAQATSFAQAKQSAIVSYYGWRVTWFSMFPNVLSLKKSDPDVRPFPLSQIIGYGLYVVFWAVVIALVCWRCRKKTT